jgi:ADP-ribose pyrophosphatase YjhB (NUDIX family)
MKPAIRHRIAGIYARGGKILLVKHRKAGREYYLLPGGGQEIGESAVEAVAREWKEELSLSVRVGQFLFCGESVPAESRRTQVFQMVFQIDAIEGNIEVKREGALAGYDWVPINSLDDIAFFPDCLAQVKAACRGERFDSYQKYRWLT